MNHLGDIAQLITALVLAATFIQSWLNGQKAKAIAKDMSELAINTNSKMDALLTARTAQATAEGDAAGLARGTAAGLEQGRNEERKSTLP